AVQRRGVLRGDVALGRGLLLGVGLLRRGLLLGGHLLLDRRFLGCGLLGGRRLLGRGGSGLGGGRGVLVVGAGRDDRSAAGDHERDDREAAASAGDEPLAALLLRGRGGGARGHAELGRGGGIGSAGLRGRGEGAVHSGCPLWTGFGGPGRGGAEGYCWEERPAAVCGCSVTECVDRPRGA